MAVVGASAKPLAHTHLIAPSSSGRTLGVCYARLYRALNTAKLLRAPSAALKAINSARPARGGAQRPDLCQGAPKCIVQYSGRERPARWRNRSIVESIRWRRALGRPAGQHWVVGARDTHARVKVGRLGAASCPAPDPNERLAACASKSHKIAAAGAAQAVPIYFTIAVRRVFVSACRSQRNCGCVRGRGLNPDRVSFVSVSLREKL